LKPEYCANPNGADDENQRCETCKPALMQMFNGFLQYFIDKGVPGFDEDSTLMDVMNVMFNDFIY